MKSISMDQILVCMTEICMQEASSDCSIRVANVQASPDLPLFGTSSSIISTMWMAMSSLWFQMKMARWRGKLRSLRASGDSCKKDFAISARSSNCCAFAIGFRTSASSWCRIWAMHSCLDLSWIRLSSIWRCLRMGAAGLQSEILTSLASASASATWSICVSSSQDTTLTWLRSSRSDSKLSSSYQNGVTLWLFRS